MNLLLHVGAAPALQSVRRFAMHLQKMKALSRQLAMHSCNILPQLENCWQHASSSTHKAMKADKTAAEMQHALQPVCAISGGHVGTDCSSHQHPECLAGLQD